MTEHRVRTVHRVKSWSASRRWPTLVFLVSVAGGLVAMEAWRAIRPEALAVHDLVEEPAPSDSTFGTALELMTGARLTRGNQVDLVLDGSTYAALWRDLRGATRTITVQMYYAMPGRVADTLAAVLCERGRAGVRVLFLLDAFGAESMSSAWRDGLRACGVRVALLRPLEWYTIHDATYRSHVRAVVVDGRIGYTGGFGIADYWLGDGHHPDQWRETNVRFEGPAVGELQAAFAAAWAEATGELIGGDVFYPPATDASPSVPAMGSPRVTPTVVPNTTRAALLFTSPTIGNTPAERFLAFAILSARHRLLITNSYFVPNRAFRRLLEEAAGRGVDVEILTAGPRTDVKSPWLAGRSYYEELLAHGIRIYEYQPTMVHSKTIAVDGAWAVVGSMNFDNHSLGFNDEANLIVVDTAFGARMDSTFVDDLRWSRQMTAAVMAAEPWWMRVAEWAAGTVGRLL